MDSLQANSFYRQWRKVFIIGGIAALLSFSGTIADIIFGSITSSDLTTLPQTAIQRFAEFHDNWLLGLYHLDLLNVLTGLLMIPAYFALFGLHRDNNLPYAALALLLAIVGTTLFTSGNSALPMLELSNRYWAAGDEVQRNLLAAAGEGLLAQGSHGSLGVFMSFSLSSLAGIMMAWVMLNGKIFGKVSACLGVIGNSLLLIYVVLVTFVPALHKVAIMLAAPGGLMALAWTFVLAIKLLKAGKVSGASA